MKSWTVLALLGWGVLSLGASRPWGYVPLLAGMATYGLVSMAARRSSHSVGRGLSFSVVILCAAVFIQLLPLPADLVAVISPALTQGDGRTASLAAPDFAFPASNRPISIDPGRTWRGFGFIVALSLFFFGMTNTMHRDDEHRLAKGLTALGVFVAVLGIAEAASFVPSVYHLAGLPLPPDSVPLGPFSSRNHYAGWILMTLSLTTGYLCAALERPERTSTSRLIVLQGAVTVMAVAIVHTRSRAGILGLAFIVVAAGALLLRRTKETTRRILNAALLLTVLLAGIMITGWAPIAERFLTSSWHTAHGRLPIWRQAAAIASDFHMTGAGFNSYETVVQFYPTVDLDAPYEGAHNDYLQLALEGGLLLGLPFLSALGFFIWETRQRIRESLGDHFTEWLRAGAIVGVVLVAFQELVDFSLQIPANAALFVVLASMAIRRAGPAAHIAPDTVAAPQPKHNE